MIAVFVSEEQVPRDHGLERVSEVDVVISKEHGYGLSQATTPKPTS